MTSPTLMAMLRKAVATRFPGLKVSAHDKVSLLEAVKEAAGWAEVVSLGQDVRYLTWHPVGRALVASSDPTAVVERWQRLERFGHSRNFTDVEDRVSDECSTTLVLNHRANDGGRIVAVNDLFLWGIFIGLMQGAHIEVVEAFLVEHPDVQLLGTIGQTIALPPTTDRLVLRCRRPRDTPRPVVPASPDGAVAARVASLLRRDLLQAWTVAAVARALAFSPRSLQRALREEGTSFSEVLMRARVEAARALLADTPLKLADIAFCVGFADQAHFARTFRRLCDVPPSAYRDILPRGDN